MNSSMTESGYGYISREVVCDKNLSRNAKAVYAYLCAFAGKKGVCYPTRERMSSELDVSKTTLASYIRELTDNNYVSLYNAGREDGRFTRTKYIINHLCLDDGTGTENNAESESDRLIFIDDEEKAYTDIKEDAIDEDTEYRAYRNAESTGGAYADRFPDLKTNSSSGHGFTGYGFTEYGSAECGFTGCGFTECGSAEYGSDGGNKNNIIKNNILKNNIIKNNNKKNNKKKNKSARMRTFGSFAQNNSYLVQKNKADIEDMLSYMPQSRLKKAIEDYVCMREEIGKPLTRTSLNAVIERVEKLGHSEDEQASIIERSVRNTWTGVYPSENDRKSESDNVFLKIIDRGEL